MGGIFKAPKPPAIPEPEPMPNPDDRENLARKRQDAARRAMSSGREATIQTGGPTNKPVGQ